MKKIILSLIIANIVGCTTAPTVESGNAQVAIRAFFQGKQQLKVRVSKIKDVNTDDVVFSFKNKSFGANDTTIPAGEYEITYSCYQEVGVATASFGEGKYPEYTERYKIKAGEIMRLSYQFVNNIKHGTHCKPVYLSN